jgi:hypothetical protein
MKPDSVLRQTWRFLNFKKIVRIETARFLNEKKWSQTCTPRTSNIFKESKLRK